MLMISETILLISAKFLSCYCHLTRANKIVKKTLIQAINGIEPNGTSNWEAGFNLAFSTFKNSRMINQSANCEKAIVLFTDETGQPVDVSFSSFFSYFLMF